MLRKALLAAGCLLLWGQAAPGQACYSGSNFDGLPDFAVFEGSAAGLNTTSRYFLYDPATRQYVDSGFAGTSVTRAEYQVVRNRMVPLAQHCYK